MTYSDWINYLLLGSNWLGESIRNNSNPQELYYNPSVTEENVAKILSLPIELGFGDTQLYDTVHHLHFCRLLNIIDGLSVRSVQYDIDKDFYKNLDIIKKCVPGASDNFIIDGIAWKLRYVNMFGEDKNLSLRIFNSKCYLLDRIYYHYVEDSDVPINGKVDIDKIESKFNDWFNNLVHSFEKLSKKEILTLLKLAAAYINDVTPISFLYAVNLYRRYNSSDELEILYRQTDRYARLGGTSSGMIYTPRLLFSAAGGPRWVLSAPHDEKSKKMDMVNTDNSSNLGDIKFDTLDLMLIGENEEVVYKYYTPFTSDRPYNIYKLAIEKMKEFPGTIAVIGDNYYDKTEFWFENRTDSNEYFIRDVKYGFELLERYGIDIRRK